MKKPLIIALLLFSLTQVGSSCKKLRELTRFKLTNTSYATVPGGGIVNLPIQIFTPDIETNSAQEFETNQTEANLVRSAFLEKLTLTIYDPNEANFDFLRSLEVFISAENQEEKSIAVITDIPQTGLQSLSMTTNSAVDLKEYVKGDSYSLRIQATTRAVPSSDVTVRLNSVFDIEAKIF